eukprot:gene10926-19760_t
MSCLDGSSNPIVCMPGPENLVMGRVIHATPNTSTCGNPASGYCRPRPNRVCDICNSSNPSKQHGTQNMQDSDYPSGYWGAVYKPTWWQSITWWDAQQRGLLIGNTVKVNLTLSMNKSFDITGDIKGDIKITFYSSRPKAMIIERSADFGRSWQPYSYYADNCDTRFATPILKKTSATIVDNYRAYCEENRNTVAEQGVIISFNPMASFTTANFWESPVQTYIKATDVRIRLEYPWTDGNHVINQESFLNQYYYDVTDLKVYGRCHCNGHGRNCHGALNQLTCECFHNTEGVDCERCQPLYNNRTWLAASGPSSPNPCQRCECNSHAQSCVFNSTLGFGVCSDCKDNTTGFFCDQCKDQFYRNMSLPLSHPQVCLSCACFSFGSINNGSCNQMATGNLTIGQCYCKSNFTGRQCDQCVDGFYGVTVPPIGQCKACGCSSIGSFNGSYTCHQVTGQCNCKPSINGITCDICRDGFHTFPNTTDGQCKRCVCDIGGAYSNVCNKTSGSCYCRSNIEGMSCDSAVNGYFVPSFDYLLAEAESSSGEYSIISDVSGHGTNFTGFGFARIRTTGRLTVYFQTQFTSRFFLVMRYKDVQPNSVQLRADVHYNNHNSSLPVTSFNITLPASNSSIPTSQIHPDAFTLLSNSNYSITFSLVNPPNTNQSIDIDSVVLMWDFNETRFYQNANGTMRNASKICWESKQRIGVQSQETVECQRIAFSVNTEVFNGSLACDCNPIGSLNSTFCAKNGGQCQCKPGVMGRKCDQCQAGYFNFTNNGCSACNCTELGSSSLVCDVITGRCPCKPGVVNRTCNACRPSFFGYQTGIGCRNCSCNWDGSEYMFCREDGSCFCKNTTTGAKCDMCKPLFFNFTATGCSPCNCDTSGSTNLQCDLQLGNCSCKSNTEGTKCDRCTANTYNLQANNSFGCQNCFCFNKTGQCSSASGIYKFDVQSQFVNTSDGWNVTNTSGAGVAYSNTASGLSVDLIDGRLLVLQAPSKYLGNKLSSYAQTLTVGYTLIPRTGVINSSVILSITFTHSDNSAVSLGLNANSSLQQQTSTVRLQEHNALTRISTWSFQHILTSVKQLSIHINATGISTFAIHIFELASTSNQAMSLQRSTFAENCSCPVNFTGTSCQQCAPGYTREFPNNGSYTNCKLCACNSRSVSCDPQNGICRNCRIGTEGNYCERCQSGVQEPDCTRCIPGFYGLNDTSFPGCRPCNCMLLNTIGQNSSVCDEITGRCNCRPNIGGRTCNRCAENAANITNPMRGCQTCSECYRLIQVEVHALRRDIANITNELASVQGIAQLSLSPSFGVRLARLTQNVSRLTANAQNSSSVESGLASELTALNYSLDAMQRLLEVNVSRSLNETNADVRVINQTRGLIAGLRNSIYALLWGSKYVLQVHVTPQVNTTEALKINISSAAAGMSSLWTNYQGQYNETSRLNREVLSLAANATSTTSNITLLRQQTENALNTSRRHLQQQRSTLQGLNLTVDVLLSSMVALRSNISQISNLANRVLADADALNVTEDQSFTQLQLRYRNLRNNITALNSSLSALNNDSEILRQSLTAMNTTAASLLDMLNIAERNATLLATQARTAQETSSSAAASARNLLAEAESMLRIMQNFNETSSAAENMAALSLRHTNEVNQSSLQAIRYTDSIKADLDAALVIAAQSLASIQNASYIAGNVSQTLDNLLNDSRRLMSAASGSLYGGNYFANIQRNVSISNATLQLRSEECRNYTAEASTSVVNATHSLNSARNLSQEVTTKQIEIETIVNNFRAIAMLNTTALRQLEQTLRQNRESFDASNVKMMLTALRSAFSTQQETLRGYRATLTRLRSDVASVKSRVDEVSTLQGCG